MTVLRFPTERTVAVQNARIVIDRFYAFEPIEVEAAAEVLDRWSGDWIDRLRVRTAREVLAREAEERRARRMAWFAKAVEAAAVLSMGAALGLFLGWQA